MSNYKDLCEALENVEIDSSRINNPNLSRIVGRVSIERNGQYIFGRWFHTEHTDIPWMDSMPEYHPEIPFHTDENVYVTINKHVDTKTMEKRKGYSESVYHTDSRSNGKIKHQDIPEVKKMEHLDNPNDQIAARRKHDEEFEAYLERFGKRCSEHMNKILDRSKYEYGHPDYQDE